jgi:hypothetical protein
MSKWFQANQLILNLTYADHLILEVETIKFLDLQWDKWITWKNHIQLLLRKFEFCLLPYEAIILCFKK